MIKKFFKQLLYYILDFHPFFYVPEYKLHGHKIEIHKNDKDIWPSYPHIHVIDDSIKINVYTGEAYRIITRQEAYRVSDKDMTKLWNDKKVLQIIMDARKNKPNNVHKLEEIPMYWLNNESKEWIKKWE